MCRRIFGTRRYLEQFWGVPPGISLESQSVAYISIAPSLNPMILILKYRHFHITLCGCMYNTSLPAEGIKVQKALKGYLRYSNCFSSRPNAHLYHDASIDRVTHISRYTHIDSALSIQRTRLVATIHNLNAATIHSSKSGL